MFYFRNTKSFQISTYKHRVKYLSKQNILLGKKINYQKYLKRRLCIVWAGPAINADFFSYYLGALQSIIERDFCQGLNKLFHLFYCHIMISLFRPAGTPFVCQFKKHQISKLYQKRPREKVCFHYVCSGLVWKIDFSLLVKSD